MSTIAKKKYVPPKTGLLDDIRLAISLLSAQHKRRLMLLFPAMLLAMLLEMASLAVLYPLIVLVMEPAKLLNITPVAMMAEWLGIADRPELLWQMMAGLVVLVFLFRTVYLLGLQYIIPRVVLGIKLDMAEGLLKLYTDAPVRKITERNAAFCQHTVLGKTGTLCKGFLQPLLNLINRLLLMFGICLLLLIMQPMIFLVVAAILAGPGLIMYRIIMPINVELGRRSRLASEQMTFWTYQALGSVRETKLLERQGFFSRRMRENGNELIKISSIRGILGGAPRKVLETLLIIGFVTALLIGLYGEMDLAAMVPVLGIFALAALRAMPLIQSTFSGIGGLRFAHASVHVLADEIRELEDALDPAEQTDDPAPLPFAQSLQAEHVSFAYDPDIPVLRDISLKVGRGETHAFVGESGTGKSTLIDILAGFLPPDSGRVLVDGQDIRTTGLPRWWRNIAYVQQDTFLLDDTLARNITFGMEPDETDTDHLKNAIESAHLAHVVAEMPDGVDTRIGERGVRLSGGQRQRIGIARAIYHGRPVLILDEATAQLDASTETAITKAIAALQGEKTILIIAHRLSTVQHADCIHLMDQGRIIASGNFADLYRSQPLFRHMVEQMQLETPDIEQAAG